MILNRAVAIARYRWPAIALGLGLAGALAASLGCRPDDESRAIVEVDDRGAAPKLFAAPFPSDVWRGSNGLLEPIAGLEAVFPRNSELVAQHLATLDGFGVRPMVIFPVDAEVDATTIADHASVHGPDGSAVDFEWRFDRQRLLIQGLPAAGVVLAPAETYVAVLRRGILDSEGRLLARARGLDRLESGRAPERWASTAAVLRSLESQQVVSLAVFTTQDSQRVLRRARAELEAGAAPDLWFPDPSLVFSGKDRLDQLLGVATRSVEGSRKDLERWGMSNPTGIAHDHVGVIATGAMTIKRFRRPDTGTDGPEDETFEVAPATGSPRLIAIEEIPVTFVLPKAEPPASGYPVVIFGHGLGASRHAMLAFAEPLTAAGYAVVAIDADGHGTRWRPIDRRNNLAAMLPDFTGESSLVDGFGDSEGLGSSFDVLEGLVNLSASRDAIRQSVLDLSQLIALLRSDLDLSALGDVHLDRDRIDYLGESFGALLGGVLAAIEPDVDLYILDVPPAGIVDLSIVGSPTMATTLEPIARLSYDLEGVLDGYHPAVSLLQSLVDAADPLTYAPNVHRNRLPVGERTPGPRHVVAIEVVGDEILPNVASDALAVALGLGVLSPHLHVPASLEAIASPATANLSEQTAVMVQYAPATHGANWTSEHGTMHFVPGFPHDGAQRFPRLDEPIRVANPIYATLE
ncbi:MAG: hypothetical protein KJO07_05020, partial [Deltaproteobacteria bacterium]|nr:hypothetical protein [Deltaproteobacteria bacterium]